MYREKRKGPRMEICETSMERSRGEGTLKEALDTGEPKEVRIVKPEGGLKFPKHPLARICDRVCVCVCV